VERGLISTFDFDDKRAPTVTDEGAIRRSPGRALPIVGDPAHIGASAAPMRLDNSISSLPTAAIPPRRSGVTPPFLAAEAKEERSFAAFFSDNFLDDFLASRVQC